MKNITRPIGVVVAAAGCAVALALSTSGSALATNQVLMVNGLASGDLTDVVMSNILGGAYAGSGYQRHNVHWPAVETPLKVGPSGIPLSVAVGEGADNLEAALAQALTQIGPGEYVTIVGLSAGSLVVDEQLRRLAGDLDAPANNQLKVVVIADANRSSFNNNRYDRVLDYTYSPPPPVKYATTVVGAEYDGFGDFPDRWWNGVAVLNAIAGIIVKHVPSMFTDLSTVPESHITVTTNILGGVTTRYLVPAEKLPLVELLPFLAPQEAQLKAIVDSAYKRNDNPGGAAALSAASVAAPASAIATPADSPAVSAPVQSVAHDPVEAPGPVDVPDVPAPKAKRAPSAAAVGDSADAVDRAPSATKPERSARAERAKPRSARGAASSNQTSG